ncbi:MAG TPA: zinc ribbon domain-containing protein [Pyrinomonadaceae bacterium]
MSEFIPAMDASGGAYVGEHSVKRVLAGDIESVRRRLAGGLEALGYTVLSENPLQARREKLKDCLRADFTDHQRRLAVLLRPSSETATTAVFDFTVVHAGLMTKGDRRTLEREVEAIIALAEAPGATAACRSCGTENGEGGRFCRLCGAPNEAGVPAELEVLRLTAASRAGLQEVVCGVVIALLSLAGALALILLSVKPKVVNLGWGILVIGQIIGWWMALYGMVRIHRGLNREPDAKPLPAVPAVTTQLPHARDAALPPAHFSVTEGTTELLGSVPREREKVPVRREHSDTSPIG